METLVSTLAWAAILQGLLLSGLYFFSKNHQSLANRLLGLFLFVIVYEGTIHFLPIKNLFGFPLYYFTIPFVKFFYPVLFFHFVLEKLGRSKAYKKYLRFQYIVAFSAILIWIFDIFLILFTGQIIEDIWGYESAEVLYLTLEYLAFLLILINVVTAFFELKRTKIIVNRNYSESRLVDIKWLWQFIFAIIPILLLWGMNLFWIATEGLNNDQFESATWGFVILFIYFVSYKAYKHKNLFNEDPENSDEMLFTKGTEGPKQDNHSAPILDEEEERLIQNIQKHMTEEQPYLDASLSIFQLSRQLNMDVRDLSLLINHKLNKHFFDFVNEYRIQKAQELLCSPEHRQKRVLEILYEVGFNSKSSFNTVFKKYTGQTPTQFRKEKGIRA